MRNCVPVLAAATFYLRRFDAIASLDLSVEPATRGRGLSDFEFLTIFLVAFESAGYWLCSVALLAAPFWDGLLNGASPQHLQATCGCSNPKLQL